MILTMRLYHFTDDAGKASRKTVGFAVALQKDRPGKVHLTQADDWAALPFPPTWRIAIDLPDDVAQAHRLPIDDTRMSEYYLFTFDEANAFQPSTVEPFTYGSA